MLRALIGAAAGLAVGAAHQEGAARDGHHVEFHFGTGDGFGVVLEVGGLDGWCIVGRTSACSRATKRHAGSGQGQQQTGARYYL